MNEQFQSRKWTTFFSFTLFDSKINSIYLHELNIIRSCGGCPLKLVKNDKIVFYIIRQFFFKDKIVAKSVLWYMVVAQYTQSGPIVKSLHKTRVWRSHSRKSPLSNSTRHWTAWSLCCRFWTVRDYSFRPPSLCTGVPVHRHPANGSSSTDPGCRPTLPQSMMELPYLQTCFMFKIWSLN